jgi:hypothetical protein
MTGGGIRVARNLSTGAVAAIALWSSYSHMVHVALHYGERPEVAYAMPFSVDGMLVVASVVMADDKRRAGRIRLIPRIAFTAGVAASVAANIAAAHPSIGARVVAAWPALALLLVVEMLARPQAHATEVPPACIAEVPPAPAASGVPQSPPEPPAYAQLPAEVTSLAIRHRTAGSRATAESRRQRPAPPVTAHRPHPAATDRPHPPARGHGTADPAPDADTQVLPPPGAVRQPDLGIAPVQDVALRGAADVSPVRVLPPTATTALGAAEVEPPDTEGSGPSRWRSQAAAAHSAGRTNPKARGGSAGRRRPTAVTRQLARQIIDAEPGLSRTEVAERLGVSARRLREVLATPA